MRSVLGLVVGAILVTATDSVAQTSRLSREATLSEASRALAAGDAERALALANAFLKRHPGSVRARVIVARVYIERDDDAAYVPLQAALRLAPRDTDALYYMGLVTARLAAAEFARLAAMAPDSARVHQLQAETLEAQEQRAAAEKEYEAALRARPDLLDALLGLGRLKRIRLACDESIVLYEKAETIRPTFEGAYGLGMCLSYLQKDDTAAARFAEAIARDPKAAVAWAGLGTSLVKLRRPAEGIEKLQHAIALEPRMAEAHYMLGMAYQAAGDDIRAKASFKTAEDLRGRE